MARSGIDSRRFNTRVAKTYVRPTSLVPDPDLVLTTDGLAFSGGLVSSWTGVDGQVYTPTAGAEPVEGSPLLNGRAGMLCPIAGGRLEYLPALSPSLTTSYSAEFVIWPENGIGEAGREYLKYCRNGSNDSPSHFIFPHQANNFDFEKIGHFASGTWRYVESAPTHKPQVITYVMSNGVLRIYRNGVLLGLDSGVAPNPTYFADTYLGSSYGSVPVTEGFHGTIFADRLWTSTALSSAHVLSSANARIAEFDIDPTEYYPADDASTITLHCDSRGKRGTGPNGKFMGDELNQWLDNGPLAHNMAQGTPGLYPSEGSYINGRYSIHTETGKWIAVGTNWAGLCGTGSQKTYDIKIVAKPISITSTQATAAHLRDCVIMDISGFLGIVFYLNSGVPTAALYHYSGGTKLLSAPVTLDEATLLHAWYDGSTIFFRVGDGAVQSMGSVGNPGDISIPVVLGHGFTTSAYADMDTPEILIRSSYNSTTANNDRAYLGRIYNLDV